jgi:ketosteroid isomerase-like protein
MENLKNNHFFSHVLTDRWGQEFAKDWLSAWNSRDVERILDCYSDEFVMMSPMVRQMTGSQKGVLMNKAELRALCTKIFSEIPELQYALVAVSVGLDKLTIHYTSSECDMVADVMNFNESWKIVSSNTFY